MLLLVILLLLLLLLLLLFFNVYYKCIYTWIFENRVNESFIFFEVVLILRLSGHSTHISKGHSIEATL